MSARARIAASLSRLRARREPPMDFVLATIGRSGSQYLVGMLDSHPELTCFGEVFHPRGSRPWSFERVDEESPMAHLRSLAAGSPGRVGFKLTTNCTAHRPELAEVAPGVARRAVLIRRPNTLAVMVSAALANESGVYHSYQGAGTYGRATIEIPATNLERRFANYRRAEAELFAGFGEMPRHTIDYAGGFSAAALDELQRFLGVGPLPLSSGTERMRRRPMREVVRNWDEVTDALEGTRSESFLLEEPGVG